MMRDGAQTAAEVLALQVLAWLATDEAQFAAFLQASGAGPGDLAAQAGDPAFLGSVMDHLLGDEARVIAFCDGAGLPYTAPMQARAALPGGDIPHWT